MDGAHISLFGALALGLVYGAGFCYRGKGPVALLVKTGSTALLALWAYLAGGPVLLVAGLALSSAGDAFLALEGERWLKPGMAAFFLAHVYWPVTLGAIMFIASDMILSLQLFRKPADQPAGTVSSLGVWTLYFGGQALIAWGVLNTLA